MIEEDELTYGETIKQPFQKLEDIDWINISARWDMGKFTPSYVDKHISISQRDYDFFKLIHENSKDFKVTWQLKQTDPHAEVKAEYEKAIAEGKIVKVFERHQQPLIDPPQHPSTYDWFQSDIKNVKYINRDYELRYYEIDWYKLLSWSYANGEFVRCQVCELGNFSTVREVRLYGLQTSLTRCFITDKGAYKYCRLAKGVEIQDEWLKEIK